MIGFQEYCINNNVSVIKLAEEIGIQAGIIWRWFQVNKIPIKYLDFLSNKFNLDKDYLIKQVNNISTYRPRQKNYFNEYEIRGEITAIFLENKKGLRLETIIDTEDLEYIKSLKYYWHLRYAPNTGTYYAQATVRITDENGKRRGISRYLHVEIMNPEHDKSIYIDHINHDTLNNTKINLRRTANNENLKHRSGKNKNNASGYRNVFWDSHREKWVVSLMIDGKNKVLGEFVYEALDKAGELAERMREKYYGEFKGED